MMQHADYYYRHHMSYNQPMQPDYYTCPPYNNNICAPQYHPSQEFYQEFYQPRIVNERAKVININNYSSNMNLLRKAIEDCDFVSLKMETGEFVEEDGVERTLMQLKTAAELYSVLRIGSTANKFFEGRLEQTEWTIYVREERIIDGIKDDAISVHREQGKSLSQNGFPWAEFFKSSINLLGTEETTNTQTQHAGYARKLREKVYPLRNFLEEVLTGKPLVASAADLMYLFKLLGYEIPSSHKELLDLLTKKHMNAFDFQLPEMAQDPATFSKKLGEQFSYSVLKGSCDLKLIEVLKNCFAKYQQARSPTPPANNDTKKLCTSNEAAKKPFPNCEVKSSNDEVKKPSTEIEVKSNNEVEIQSANNQVSINEVKNLSAISETKNAFINTEDKKLSANSEVKEPSDNDEDKKASANNKVKIQTTLMKTEVVKKIEVVAKEENKKSEPEKVDGLNLEKAQMPEKQKDEKKVFPANNLNQAASLVANSTQTQVKSEQVLRRELNEKSKDKDQTAIKKTATNTNIPNEKKRSSSDESDKKVKKVKEQSKISILAKSNLKDSSKSVNSNSAVKKLFPNPNHSISNNTNRQQNPAYSSSPMNAQASKRKNKK